MGSLGINPWQRLAAIVGAIVLLWNAYTRYESQDSWATTFFIAVALGVVALTDRRDGEPWLPTPSAKKDPSKFTEFGEHSPTDVTRRAGKLRSPLLLFTAIAGLLVLIYLFSDVKRQDASQGNYSPPFVDSASSGADPGYLPQPSPSSPVTVDPATSEPTNSQMPQANIPTEAEQDVPHSALAMPVENSSADSTNSGTGDHPADEAAPMP